jgi:hypothetical protein
MDLLKQCYNCLGFVETNGGWRGWWASGEGMDDVGRRALRGNIRFRGLRWGATNAD